jgi:L-2-hydroxyglutarate oxidase
MITADFLIIGGGIIGLSIAREIRYKYKSCKIIVIDKEKKLGCHASGRNSGVIHAGFYYSAETLKARLCREGNAELRTFISKNKLSINQCGKIVVAQSESDLKQLHVLKERGQQNGVELQLITEREARLIEPRIKTFEQALWSPNTATADPYEIIYAMQQDALKSNIKILFESKYIKVSNSIVWAGNECISANHIVNCAGLYADHVAINFGFSENYRILPFKGLYLYSDEAPHSLKTNVYPVPDLRNPFLGVHFTVTVAGKTKIGPTAIPAIWREQYSGFSSFNITEAIEILWRDLGLIVSGGFDFRRLALEETLKYSKRRLVALAGRLLSGVEPKHFSRWGNPGIRAQLLNIKTRRLEMDFIVEGDRKSTHVLNAVSPAWTCSIPFAKHICSLIDSRL